MLRKILSYLKLFLILPGSFNLFYKDYYDKKFWGVISRWAGLHRRVIVPGSRIICVIGSLGKTTTTLVLRSVLFKKPRHQAAGNFGSFTAENVLRLRPWDKHGVIEVAVSGPNQMHFYPPMIKPDIVVVTSIKSDHRRSFNTLIDTRNEKVIMLKGMSSDGLAVLNGDDPNVKWMATQTKAKIVTFGFNQDNDIRADQLSIDWPKGTRFTIHADGQSQEAFIPLFGAHFVYCALAAVAVGLNENETLETLVEKLKTIDYVIARLEPIKLNNGITLIDDAFKGSMDSLKAALKVFSEIKAKRKICVLGDIEEPPDNPREAYQELGRLAAQASDMIVFIGSDNYSRIRVGAKEAGFKHDAFINAGSRIMEAVSILKEQIREGDVVLFKGRGTQRFRRIILALQGKEVRCNVKYCNVKIITCDRCPYLDKEGKIFENVYIRNHVRP